MNEISRCCRLLGVKSGASVDDLKRAYRDLVQIWHPDRFANNERLQSKAQEQLKEINAAFEYLLENAFQDGILVEPAEMESAREDSTQSGGDRNKSGPDSDVPVDIEPSRYMSRWVAGVGLAAILLVAGSALFYLLGHHGSNRAPAPKEPPTVAAGDPPVVESAPVASLPPAAPAAAVTNSETHPVPEWRTNQFFRQDILHSTIPVNGERVSPAPEGISLETAVSEWEHVQSSQLLSPPFVMLARVKLAELNDLRLYYGLGGIVFNSSEQPGELRVFSPNDGAPARVPDRGGLQPGGWHELAWEIDKTSMSLAVDGETRFWTNGDYAALKAYPGIGPPHKGVLVQSFFVETPQAWKPLAVPARNHGPVVGDLLSVMVAESNLKLERQPDGLLLAMATGAGTENFLHVPDQIHAPFTIRTRAKTDSTNLRLVCGPGSVIFNWELNPTQLVVTDPKSRSVIKTDGKGLISPNEWHAIVWDFKNDHMTLTVDGDIRFEKSGLYSKLKVRPGIGAAWSRVTVDYFMVEKPR